MGEAFARYCSGIELAPCSGLRGVPRHMLPAWDSAFQGGKGADERQDRASTEGLALLLPAGSLQNLEDHEASLWEPRSLFCRSLYGLRGRGFG